MRAGPLLVGLVAATLLLTAYNTLTAPGGISPAGDDDGDRLVAIEERLGRIEERLDGLRTDVRSASREASATRRTVAAAGGVGSLDVGAASGATLGAALGAGPPGAPDGWSGDPAASAALEEAVAARVEKTLSRLAERERYRGDDGQWKPPLDALGRVVELNETQQASLRQVFDGARDEAFALLSARRSDGGTLLDDFVADLREKGQEQAATARLFTRLATEEAPGHNRTYLAVLGEASERIQGEVARHLRPNQAEQFRDLNVDVFDVKTGHDPIGAYVLERLGRSE